MVTGKIATSPQQVVYDPELESFINEIEKRLTPYLPDWISSRWVALRLLERDYNILNHIGNKNEPFPQQVVKEKVALCLQ